MPKACLRFVLGTVCVYGLAAAAAANAHSSSMPLNIIVDRALDDVADYMIDRSPTFREQVLHLGSLALVRIRIVLLPTVGPSAHAPPCRADADLRRYEFGRIDALVRLPSRLHAPELIAHALEHVREFAEGVNFRLLAARASSGVWHARSGHYETARALAIGKRVALEVKRGTVQLRTASR